MDLFPQVTQSELDVDTVKAILGEYRISNADVTLKYDATTEDLIDVIEGNRVYIPCIYVLNKIDQISIEVSSWYVALLPVLGYLFDTSLHSVVDWLHFTPHLMTFMRLRTLPANECALGFFLLLLL